MPIRFRYHPERALLIHVGEGRVSLEDISRLRRERREAGVPPAVPHTLTDMRRARFDFDPAALQEHESEVSEEEFAGARHAEIVADPTQTAILMLWRAWLPEGIVVEIFSTPEAAFEWLGVDMREGDLEV